MVCGRIIAVVLCIYKGKISLEAVDYNIQPFCVRNELSNTAVVYVFLMLSLPPLKFMAATEEVCFLKYF